jgi:hypothetical protein
MREELWAVDKALGFLSMGQDARLGAIKETQDRYSQANAEMWRLREALAQVTPAPEASASDV